jgi:hypothetical protein
MKSGVRQGCILSLVLFDIIIDYVLRKCNFRGGIQLNLNHTFSNGDFADDITLVSHSKEEQHNNIVVLFSMAGQVGLSISTKKT